jgi:hypothetical protein
MRERMAEGAEVLEGIGAGGVAGIGGLIPDVLALLGRDAPMLFSKYVMGEELSEDENALFRALTKVQDVAGAEAILRGMGYGEKIDAPSDSPDALSQMGVNPFRQGAFFGEFVADPFAAFKGIKALKALGPSDEAVAAYDRQLGGTGSPDFGVTDAPEAPPGGFMSTGTDGGPDFDVDQNLADLMDAAAADRAEDAGTEVVSDTPQVGFSGVVDTPVVEPTFPSIVDRDSVDVDQVPVLRPDRQGDVAAYAPLRQLLAALPAQGSLSKDQILRSLDPASGSQEFRNSVQRDIQGSQFDEWVRKHVPDGEGVTRDELLLAYDELAPQIRVLNVLESDLELNPTLFNFSELPNSGAQESVDSDFIVRAANGEQNRGHIYLSNPTSATVPYRDRDGELKEYALTGTSDDGTGTHGMGAPKGNALEPYNNRILGYFGHLRYVEIEDDAGRRIMLLQEVQSNHTVTQASGSDVNFLTPSEKQNVRYLAENPGVQDQLTLSNTLDDAVQDFDSEVGTRLLSSNDLELNYGVMSRIVADALLDTYDDTTLLRAFNHRTRRLFGATSEGGGARQNLIKDALVQLPPGPAAEFNRVFLDRMSDFENIDGDLLNPGEILSNRLLSPGSDVNSPTQMNNRADYASGVFRRLKRRMDRDGVTPHEYFVNNPGELSLYMSADSHLFGDLGRFETNDAFRASPRTTMSAYAAEVDDYITGIVMDRAKTRLESDEPFAGLNLSSERVEELKKTAEVLNRTIGGSSFGGTGEFRTMSPFAQTRHFEEFAPKLLLQEARKAGFDGVIFPNYQDMKDVGGRPSGPTVKNIYEKGVKKGLNQLGVTVTNLDTVRAKNFSTNTVEVLPHKRTGDPHRGAKAVYFEGENENIVSPSKIIRRAKGGPVDLRPKKLIHSGIGAMARQVM